MYLKVETTDAANKLSELLKDGDWMVLYYAEWCGHCNTMKPEWQKVIEKLKDSGKINVADVKSDIIEKLSHNPKIEGFPTIKMYNKGREVAKFEDERSAEKLEKFAISNANTNSDKKKSKTALNTALETLAKKDTVNTANKVNTANTANTANIANTANTTNTTNTANTANTIKINLEELPVAPSPIVLRDNSNEVKKLSISQLKDEIMKSHRKSNDTVIEIKNENNQVKSRVSAKQAATADLGDLQMLLQQPAFSAKASKKPAFLKKKTKKNGKRNSKMKSPVNNKKNNKVPANPVAPLSCSDIRKAKLCKTNPKCIYDYIEFKCKDKSNGLEPKLNIINANKGTKRSKKTQGQSKGKSQGQRLSQPNNKKNETKAILHELQKSFKTISNEARKDSNLLEKASKHI